MKSVVRRTSSPLFASALLILAAACGAVAQESLDKDKTVVLPDSVMRQVVGRIARWHFKPGRAPRTVPVAETSIKREWLPTIPNVTFQFVSENDAVNYEKGVFFVQPVKLDGRAYSVNAGWGDFQCEASGQTWKFTTNDNRVRLWPTGLGWGQGCGGDAPPVMRGLQVGDVSPNELPGYEFFSKGKLKGIRLGVSTREDMKRIFGDTCEGPCDYDENWEVWVNYFAENETTKTTSDNEAFETIWTPKAKFAGTLKFVNLLPKKRVSFLGIVFQKRFGRSVGAVIGDAWDEKGFAGAVHTRIDRYTDGYGLSYEVYNAETFNNLRSKQISADPAPQKGDLISIEYEIPDSLDDTIYLKSTKPAQKR
ncbi:MAG TPA: hypothetical protein VMZ26_08920 [Pyrinomonadaceae bacterium]|nr:hypothetical protein [Pyrinomonadaceae bacterium]